MKVNEIFYSIQGEGFYTGRAAVFVRFSGCNLKCPFCDTDFRQYTEMSEDKIVREVSKYPAALVVLTGGEPTLQLTASFVDKLHLLGKYVAVETNGTRVLPENVDWITVSPKQAYVGNAGKPILTYANEVKIVLDDKCEYDNPTFGIVAENYYVQPCDSYDEAKNKEAYKRCVEFVKANPRWRISLQTQKVLNVR